MPIRNVVGNVPDPDELYGLAQLPPAERRLLSSEVIARVYREKVLGPTCKHYFDHYRERLHRLGTRIERCANAILQAVADAPRGRLSRSVLQEVYSRARGRGADDLEFSDLLADLECDWYFTLDPLTNEFYFRVAVIRDWWRRWHPSPQRPRD